MKWFFFSLCLLALTSCVQPRVRRYQSALDPLLGQGKRADVDRILGRPVSCEKAGEGEKCEYRTAFGRNDPIPAASQKTLLGPDLSPYEYYDVVRAEYDGLGIFRNWQYLKP